MEESEQKREKERRERKQKGSGYIAGESKFELRKLGWPRKKSNNLDQALLP